MGIESAHYILGIDGGGTGCRAALSDARGTIIGRGVGGAANIAGDFHVTAANVLSAVKSAYIEAGIPETHVTQDVAVLGLAGSNVSNLAEQFQKEMPFLQCKVVSDRETTVQGALGGKDGCVGVIGTGSFFVGQHNNKKISIGGWGFKVGDDGSGARIGQVLLKKTILAHDHMLDHSPITRDILQNFGGSPVGISRFAQTAKPRDYATFAPRIIEGVRDNDPIAVAIFNDAINAVQHALDVIGAVECGTLCLLGGLGPIYEEFIAPKYQTLCIPPKGKAEEGAIALAQAEFKSILGGRHENS